MINILNRTYYLKAAIVINCILFGVNCRAQTYSSGDFVKIPIPVAEGNKWLEYNQSALIPFEVSTVNGQLKISKWKYISTDVYRMPEGMFLAVDEGEFGGGLYYKPDDSTKTRFYIDGKPTSTNENLTYYRLVLKDKNIPAQTAGKYLSVCGGHVKKFFVYRDSLYFIEGIDHMGFDSGALCKLECKGDSFKVVELLTFEDAPHAICVYGDKILIATFRNFYVIENWHKELMFDHIFWYGFNPNSIAVDKDEKVYVGMFGFYTKIDLKKRIMELYKYDK